MTVAFVLNGKKVREDVPPGMTLLDYLRKNGFFSVKFSSERGETGSDTVLIDGQAMNAGLILLFTLAGKDVETVESFATGTHVHPLQLAFLDEGAIQCGYCTPGMLLAVEALLRLHPEPTEEEIREALAGVYCRCTGYVKPVRAVMNYCSRNRS